MISIIFLDLIKDISDPEHPLSLEELRVVEEQLIEVCVVFGMSSKKLSHILEI